MIGAAVAAYALISLATGYSLARWVGDSRLGSVGMMWPVLLLLAPFVIAGELGARHSK